MKLCFGLELCKCVLDTCTCIYGKHTSDILEKGILNATDSDDFHATRLYLEPR